MQFGEAAVSVSWFARRVGPVFLSGTSNMLILLGRGLELSLFFREELHCVSATPSASCRQPRVCRRDHQPSVDVTFTDFFRRTDAMFQV